MATVFGEREAHLANRINALELTAAHHTETRDRGTDVGAADTGIWWANQTRQTRRVAKGRLKLAGALDQHDTTRTALAAGAIAEDQAAVIVTAVDQLPAMQAEAETELVRLAAHHDAGELKLLAKRILDVVAPEIAEAHEREALEREEERAAEACRFTISDDGHGQCHGRFTMPSHVGAMLKKCVRAYASPKHRHHSATQKGMGHAFCEYVERYTISDLPSAGGVDATTPAPPKAATGQPRCPTSTTTNPGAEAAERQSPTDGSSAPGTTPTPTHRSTR